MTKLNEERTVRVSSPVVLMGMCPVKRKKEECTKHLFIAFTVCWHCWPFTACPFFFFWSFCSGKGRERLGQTNGTNQHGAATCGRIHSISNFRTQAQVQR